MIYLSVASLVVAVGRALHLSERAKLELEVGAGLHDVGKLALPDAILGKRESLGEAEMAAIRAHPELGERILSPLPFAHKVRKVVRWHHEWMSGEGCPDGLRGEEIPLGARIVAICDAYDAMTNSRWYRPPRTTEKALGILMQDEGERWDVGLMETYVRVVWQGATKSCPGLLSLACPGTPCPLAHFRQDWAEPDRVFLILTGSLWDRIPREGMASQGPCWVRSVLVPRPGKYRRGRLGPRSVNRPIVSLVDAEEPLGAN